MNCMSYLKNHYDTISCLNQNQKLSIKLLHNHSPLLEVHSDFLSDTTKFISFSFILTFRTLLKNPVNGPVGYFWTQEHLEKKYDRWYNFLF